MSGSQTGASKGLLSQLNLFWLGMGLALLFWLLESAAHFHFYQAGQEHPVLKAVTAMDDPDELTMRFLIVALLTGFGYVAEKMRQSERRHGLRAKKVNRLLRFLREIFHHSQGYKDKQALLDVACESAVNTARACFAWIGIKKDGVLELSAWHTLDDVMQEEVSRLKRPVDLECCKVTLAVLNEGIPVQCELEGRHDCSAPWVKVFLNQGCSQAISLPLRIDKDVVGIFEIFAGSEGAFEREEIAILEEAASDISMALEAMAHEQQREEAERKMRQHIDELERFQRATVQREFRIRELREEIKLLQVKNSDKENGDPS